MSIFRKILFVPFDGFDNLAAITAVAQVATENESRLELLATVDGPSRLQQSVHDRSYFDAIQTAELQALRREISRWTLEAGCPDIGVNVELGRSASTAALNRVNLRHYDLLAVPGPVGELQHGIVRDLIRKSPVPVWLVHTQEDLSTGAVVAAVDPCTELELNRQILQMAAAFTLPGGTVEVVTAWELYGERMLHRSGEDPASGNLDELLLEEEESVRLAVENLLQKVRLPDREWRIHVAHGHPASVIPELLDQLGASVLAIGTVAQSGLSGLSMGNTTEAVLDAVDLSVVAVKSPGLTSPVHFSPVDFAAPASMTASA